MECYLCGPSVNINTKTLVLRKPHLRLHYGPARGRTVEHWMVVGPNGHTLWGSGRTAAGAILAYQLGHVFKRK